MRREGREGEERRSIGGFVGREEVSEFGEIGERVGS